LKCGGEKALTKHVPDEALKCHLTVEEPKELVEENALVVSNVPVSSELESKLKVTQLNQVKPEITNPGTVMPELYNLEECAEKEKPVKIDLDLDLYQMEKV
jgi:hypothetical protein